jgi:hypothetical protein
MSPSVIEPDAKETVGKFIPRVLEVGVQVSPSDDRVRSNKVWTVTELRGAQHSATSSNSFH